MAVDVIYFKILFIHSTICAEVDLVKSEWRPRVLVKFFYNVSTIIFISYIFYNSSHKSNNISSIKSLSPDQKIHVHGVTLIIRIFGIYDAS